MHKITLNTQSHQDTINKIKKKLEEIQISESEYSTEKNGMSRGKLLAKLERYRIKKTESNKNLEQAEALAKEYLSLFDELIPSVTPPENLSSEIKNLFEHYKKYHKEKWAQILNPNRKEESYFYWQRFFTSFKFWFTIAFSLGAYLALKSLFN